jgi:hypothetical protein
MTTPHPPPRPVRISHEIGAVNFPTSLSTDDLVHAYLRAKRSVIEYGYAHEVAWQSAAAAEPLTPERFLQEAAWVVLSTGMSEAVVRRLYPKLAARLRGFNPEWVATNAAAAREKALAIFGHEGKIDSVLHIAATAHALGSEGLRRCMRDPESFLLGLPYIGPITWRHLAKNLGMPTAKADRHLSRFAKAVGRLSPDDLCTEISTWVGDPVPVVDIILWRWSVLHARSCGTKCSCRPLDDGPGTSGCRIGIAAQGCCGARRHCEDAPADRERQTAPPEGGLTTASGP